MTGHQVKLLRTRLGMNQTEFAAALGKSAAEVSRWENGVRKIPKAEVMAMAYLESQSEDQKNTP